MSCFPYEERAQLTFNQKVPRFRRIARLSIAHSFAPGVTGSENLPMWSSVMFPTSLSLTSTVRVAVLGTFLIFHSSFHTGESVSIFTVDLQMT